MAERAGFEPALGYYPKHAFQACDLNRSSTSPRSGASYRKALRAAIHTAVSVHAANIFARSLKPGFAAPSARE